jgi:transcription initiation factor TFIID subunit 15
MFSQFFLIASLASAGLIEGAALDLSNNANIVARQQRGGGQQGGQQGGQTCLKTNLIQTASGLTGQEPGTDGIKPGQAPSAV